MDVDLRMPSSFMAPNPQLSIDASKMNDWMKAPRSIDQCSLFSVVRNKAAFPIVWIYTCTIVGRQKKMWGLSITSQCLFVMRCIDLGSRRLLRALYLISLMEKHLGLTAIAYLKVEFRFFPWSLVLTDLFYYFINLNNFLVGQNWSHRWLPHIIRDFLLTCEQNLMLNFLPYSIFVNCTSVRLSCQLYYLDSGLWLLCLSFGYAVMRRKIPDGKSHKFFFLYFFYYFFLKFKKKTGFFTGLSILTSWPLAWRVTLFRFNHSLLNIHVITS